MSASSKALRPALFGQTRCQSVTCMARTWHASIGDDGAPQPPLIPGQAFAVYALHPGSLRIEEVRTDPVMKEAIARAKCCMVTPFGVFVSDGKRQYELSTTSHVFIEDQAAPTLDKVQGKHGLPTLIAPDVLFAADPLRDWLYVGEANWEDTPVDSYQREQSGEGETWEEQLTIARETGLPLRISRFSSTPSGQVEGQRTDFSDWVLNPILPISTFDTTPPEDAHPEPPRQPHFDSAWKPGMQPAPFEATNLSGDPISLDQYRGKVVLLDFWAMWCVPCCKAMVYIRAAYEEFHSRGFEVIGISFDRTDDRNRLLEYIARNQLTWRHVHDGQGFQSLLATPYKVHAIPFTLLIGRDGKIAAVNVHGEELKPAIQRALKIG